MYQYELHCHTGGVSLCAAIPPKELVRKYEKAGYSGLVLTDHYSPMTFMFHHFLRPQRAMEHYLSSYREEKKLYTEAHRQGYLVFQAHPYRPLIRRCDPRYLDGIEVFNGHTDAQRNQKALAWALSLNKPMTSGSDTHRGTDSILGGIATQTPIYTNADLLDVLRGQRYSLLTPQGSDTAEKAKAG